MMAAARSATLPTAILGTSLLAFCLLSANRFYKPGCGWRSRHTLEQPGGGAATAVAAGGGGDGGGGAEPPNAEPQRSNYVLTVVSGDLHQNWTSVFIRSWQRYSPDTKVVVFVDEAAAAKQEVLREFGAELVPFTLPPDAFVVAHRFELWLGWLREHGNRAGGVMLTDARDVYIQADPWADPRVKEVVGANATLFTLEGGRAIGDLQIQQQAQNVKWASTCFSKEVYEQLAGKAISCAGVTIGAAPAVRAYIEQWFDAWRNDVEPACRKITGDQAVHNYLLHYLGPRGRLRFEHRALSNWESPVITATYAWPMRVDRYGRLHRLNGTFPAVVHQYDRSAKLRLLMFAQYPIVPEMDWPPPECDRGLLGVPGIRMCAKGEKGYPPGQI